MTEAVGAAFVALTWSIVVGVLDPLTDGLVHPPWGRLVAVGGAIALSLAIAQRARGAPGGLGNALAGWIVGAALGAAWSPGGLAGGAPLDGVGLRVLDVGFVTQAGLAAAAPAWSPPGRAARALAAAAAVHAALSLCGLGGWGGSPAAGLAACVGGGLAAAAPPPDPVGSRLAGVAAGLAAGGLWAMAGGRPGDAGIAAVATGACAVAAGHLRARWAAREPATGA